MFQYALRAHRHGGDRAQDGFLRRPRRLLLRSVSGQRLRRQFCECLGEGPLQRAGVWPRGRFPAPELRHTRKAVCVGGRGEGAPPARHHAPRCSAGEAPGSGAAVSAFRVGSDGRRAGAPLRCRERGRGGLFRGHDPEARALCFVWSISGVYRLAPARPGAHGPSHRRIQSPELPTPRRPVWVWNPVPLPMLRQLLELSPPGEPRSPAGYSLRCLFGHKASVHISDAPSPGPSLRNYTPIFKNARARVCVRARTYTHGLVLSPVLSLLFYELLSGSVQLRCWPWPLKALWFYQKKGNSPSILPITVPAPASGSKGTGPGTAASKALTLHPVPTWDLWRWQFKKGMRRAEQLG